MIHGVSLAATFAAVVPALLRSLTSSPRVVLGCFLNVLMIVCTPLGELLEHPGAPGCARLSVDLYSFHFPKIIMFTADKDGWMD